MKIWHHPVWTSLSALAILSGVFYFLQAAKVESYTSVRTILLAPIAFGHAAVVFGMLKRLNHAGFLLFAICLIAQDSLIGLTLKIDQNELTRLKLEGLEIIQTLNQQKLKNGSYPKDVHAALPFEYSYVSNSEFKLQFKGPPSTICIFQEASIPEANWRCN